VESEGYVSFLTASRSLNTNLTQIYLLADEYDSQANKYMNPHQGFSWERSLAGRWYMSWWATIKSNRDIIRRIFITGVSPVPLADIASGLNNVHNITFDSRFARLCGLTKTEIEDGLSLISSDPDIRTAHLQSLAHFANGFNFSRDGKAQTVYNTETVIEYLQVS